MHQVSNFTGASCFAAALLNVARKVAMNTWCFMVVEFVVFKEVKRNGMNLGKLGVKSRPEQLNQMSHSAKLFKQRIITILLNVFVGCHETVCCRENVHSARHETPQQRQLFNLDPNSLY